MQSWYERRRFIRMVVDNKLCFAQQELWFPRISIEKCIGRIRAAVLIRKITPHTVDIEAIYIDHLISFYFLNNKLFQNYLL